MKQLQPKAIDGLWKVLFYLPRFLFFIPIGGPPVGTRQVAAVAENVRLFKGENAAARLWRASHNFGVSSTLYNVSEDDINEGIYESKDEIAQNRKWERVKVACADGDITKAAQYAAPEAKIANITSEGLGKYVEEVFKVPDGATKNPPPSDREVAEFIDTILEDAGRNEEAEFTTTHVDQVIGGYRPTSPPDGGGWRPVHLKSLIRDLHLDEEVLPILLKIARGDLTPDASIIVHSMGFFALEDESEKKRFVASPTTWARAAHAALAKARLTQGTLAQDLISSGQYGLMKGSTEIAAHLNNLTMAAGNDQDEIMVSLDMRKMYYRMNKQAAATALRDRGEWQLLRAMKAAFCEGANTLICTSNQRDGTKARLRPPPGGIPPGDPISTVICVVALAACIQDAKDQVYHQIRQENPTMPRRAAKESVDRDLFFKAIADDITISGDRKLVTIATQALTTACYNTGTGSFGIEKSMVTTTGGASGGRVLQRITGQVVYDISKALLTPPERDEILGEERRTHQHAELPDGRKVSIVVDEEMLDRMPLEEVPGSPSEFRYNGHPVIINGAANVGGVIGNAKAHQGQIGVRATKAIEAIYQTTQCPDKQVGTLVLRLCASTKFQSTARIMFPSQVRAIAGDRLEAANLEAAERCFGQGAVGPGDEYEVQRAMLETPVRLGGMGLSNTAPIAAGAFLAAALAAFNFIETNFKDPRNRIRRATDTIYAEVDEALRTGAGPEGNQDATDARVSQYALEIATGIREFNRLFREVNGRAQDVAADGFGTTLQTLLPIATKFQLRFTTLVGKVRKKGIAGLLGEEQTAMLRSQESATSAPFLMGLPTGHNTLPNCAFQYIAQRRLLLTNKGQLEFGDRCAAYPMKCGGGGSGTTTSVDDRHLETCTSVKSGDITRRHRQLQDVLVEMLQAAGARVALADATDDYITRARLADAGVTPKARGRTTGGDILVRAGLRGKDTPTVIDLTVVSEAVITNCRDEYPAKTAELEKVGTRKGYKEMYEKIGYGFRAFGVEVGGRLGPEAEGLIQIAKEMWWTVKGKGVLPEGANWTCPSFTSYWRQRVVGVVQGFTAEMTLARSRRVAELRVTV